MLKNLDPLLNADVLHALRAMGHGDEVVICDANFPGDSVARATVLGKLLRLDVDAARAELPRLKARILGWLTLLAVAVTVVCTWVGVSKISLFAHGWKWCFGRGGSV